MAHQAVIFDLFGTLVDIFSLSEHRRVLAAMAGILGATADQFTRLWIGTFNQRCNGEFPSVEANVLHVCATMGVEPSDAQVREAARLRFELTERHLRPRAGAIELLSGLRGKGLKTGLISDCSTEMKTLWPTSPLAPLVDVAIFSFVVRLKKPDPRIYLMACQRLGVEPRHCLYVGDGGSRELSGARQVGMHPVLIRAASEDPADVHRVDAEPWSGPRVESLGEILEMIVPEQG